MTTKGRDGDGDPRLTYTVQETARLLGVSSDLVYHLCERGELAFIRTGRRKLVLAESLSRWLERSRDPESAEGPDSRASSAGNDGEEPTA